MRATHAIKARVAASKWRPFGRRKLWLIHGTGETFVVTAKAYCAPKLGDDITILDTLNPERFLAQRSNPARLYVNFEKEGLSPEGNYGVWVAGKDITYPQRALEFESLSSMIDDWFAVMDDHDLTLLRIQIGGPFSISNDTQARV